MHLACCESCVSAPVVNMVYLDNDPLHTWCSLLHPCICCEHNRAHPDPVSSSAWILLHLARIHAAVHYPTLYPAVFDCTCESAGWNYASCICRERHAGSRRPNSGDHAGPGKKCLVMSVAIPLLAGACVLGAGLLIGPHIVGRMSSVKTSMLSW